MNFLEVIQCLKKHNCRIYTLEFWNLEKENWKNNIVSAYTFMTKILNSMGNE